MSAKGFSGIFCQICLLFCQVLFRRNLLMSAWTELACLQYLPGELNQRLLEVSPTACLSVSSSGSLGFLLGRASRRFSCLLPSVSKQSYPQELRSFCYSVSLFYLSLFFISDGVGVHSSSVSVGCQLDVFSVSFNILFQNLSDLLLIFPHTKFLSRLYKCMHLQV